MRLRSLAPSGPIAGLRRFGPSAQCPPPEGAGLPFVRGEPVDGTALSAPSRVEEDHPFYSGRFEFSEDGRLEHPKDAGTLGEEWSPLGVVQSEGLVDVEPGRGCGRQH